MVQRLLASRFPLESVLLAQRKVASIAPLVAPQTPLYVVPNAMIHQVVGFKFHTGVIACGRRAASPALTDVDPTTLVVCPEIASAANLGSIVRIAAAFSATAVVLGEQCCDPFYRQSIRVSMGAVFNLPLVRSDDLLRDLAWLRTQRSVELIASVLDEDAEPLARVTCKGNIALLLGNEAQGLGRKWTDACNRRVTIPMGPGADSLSVHVAAAVMLYHLTMLDRRES